MPSSSHARVTDSVAVADACVVAQRYHIESRIGRGGAGAVFRARDASTGRTLALKRLHGGKGARVRALFEFEYYTLASLQSPHVVQAYDFGSDETGPYYTMELLSGSDLADAGPLPWPEACRIVGEAASALGLLHARRLVHRDISPRNLWRTPSGLIKLIDFGALTPFGQSDEVVGTPPFVAPEAFHGQALDSRTDLYALGAVLYWLLTGSHAYPAKRLRDLPTFWSARVPPASARKEKLERADLPAIPSELDALIEALLSADPRARPSNVADLNDRLLAMAGVEGKTFSFSTMRSLPQALFVGREREQRHFRRHLQAVRQGEGKLTIIHARSGLGRTRLLTEFGLDARLSGATVLQVDAAACDGEHGVIEAVAQRLLDALPELAGATAAPRAAVLGHLSPRLRERISATSLAAIPSVAGEARTRIHEAMNAWLAEVCREAPLVLLVDNLEHAGESAIAWFLTLSMMLQDRRLLVVLGLKQELGGKLDLALRRLIEGAGRIALKPLAEADVRLLFASLFGEVPHLDRFAQRLSRVARGNPAHLVELAEHLIREDVVTSVEGTWMLPHDLSDAQLAVSRRDALASRLSRLSQPAREVGRLLSIHQGLIPHELAAALAPGDPKALHLALTELVQEGVLVGSPEGVRFRDDPTREAFFEVLSSQERRDASGRLGNLLLAREAPRPEEKLEAYVLLLEQDGERDVSGELVRLAQQLTLTAPDKLIAVAPLLERALRVFRDKGRRGHELITLLAALTVAGYFGDRVYLERYAEDAVQTLSAALRIPLMHRTRPWLGKKLSLWLGLLAAGIGFRRRRRNPCVPAFRETMLMFFNLMGSLAGVATICIDPLQGRRYQSLLAPFAALSDKTPARFIYRYVTVLAEAVEDRLGEAYADWQALIADLRDPARCPSLPDQLRARFLGGALYACGVLQCFRDDESVLRAADELENYAIKYYRMSADQLRAMYFANQGQLELAEHYRRRAELHAIQRGSAWQIEIWVPAASITAHLRTDDALGMKHAHAQLVQQAKRTPSLRLLADRARGVYLLLRGKHREAIPYLESCLAEPPLGVIGWARAHGALARALNGASDHVRAKEVCARALSQLTPDDLSFSGINLGVQIEHALARAGMGEQDQAAAELDALLAHHASQGSPLSLGALHEARARVALMAQDEATCRAHQAEMESRFRATTIPSLIARCERFEREVHSRFSPTSLAAGETGTHAVTSLSAFSMTGVEGGTGLTFFEQALTDATSFEDCVQRALRLLVEGVSRPWAGMWLWDEEEPSLVASLGGELPDEVRAWVAEQIAQSQVDDVTQTDSVQERTGVDPHVLVYGGSVYRLCLVPDPAATGGWMGALVIGSPFRAVPCPGFHVLETLAIKLRQTRQRSQRLSGVMQT